MITTCWSDKPEERCELSVVHHVFLMTSLQNAKPDKSGDLSIHNNRNLTIAEKF
jgi:hypothetical protein